MTAHDFQIYREWTLITIEDVENLPGKNIFDLIKILLNVIDYQFVVLDYIYGAGIFSLLEKQNSIITIDELLKMLPEVKQFDWGDFFLFKNYPKHWNNSKEKLYPYIIEQTDSTIRAIDDGYIYIYTPFQLIIDVILENYKIESIKTDLLEKLDFPD